MSRARAAGDLRVVGAHGAGHDDDVGARDVLGAVADADAGAQRRQPARDVALAQVGAGDRVAEVQQHLGDAGHADAADADEVDGDVALSEHGGRGVLARAAVAGFIRRGGRWRAARRRCRGWRSARASVPIAARHAARRAGSAGSRRPGRPAASPTLRAWGSTTAAPARSNSSAFFVWWSSAAVGSGIRIAGRPHDRQLGQRQRARARDARPPPGASTAGMSSMNARTSTRLS